MKIIERDWDRYAEIKITTTDHCQACSKSLDNMEIAYFAPLDNNIICKECAQEHKSKEPRLYIRD